MAFSLPSDEDIRAIKAGDVEKINAFFLQSIEFIRLCACGFYTRIWKKAYFTQTDIDELVNEAYLHLSELDYDSVSYFEVSLRDVFFFFQFGGRKLYYRYYGTGKQLCESLDKPVNVVSRTGDSEEGTTRGDLLEAHEPIPCAEVERQYAILKKIVRNYLTEKEYEIFLYRILTGYSASEIAEDLGKSKGAVLSQMCTMKKALVIHYKEILALMRKYGMTETEYYIKHVIEPPDYEKVKTFYEKRRERSRERVRRLVSEAGGRERKNEYQRAYRARKKLVESPTTGKKIKNRKRSE